MGTRTMTGAPKIGRNMGNAGKGRPKGATNKVSKALKDMILGALDDAGGQAYLEKQAVENPTAFMTLVGKVLPLQVAGDKDNPINVISTVRREVIDKAAQRDA